MDIIKLEVPEKLKHVVRTFWYRNEKGCHEHEKGSYESSGKCRILADGAPGIVFQHYNGYSSVLNRDHSYLPRSFVYGQSTSHCINKIIRRPFIFGLNFQATGLKTLFSIDSSELTNEILDTEYLFGREFNEQLVNACGPAEMIRLFSKRFLKLLNDEEDAIIDRSIRLITRNPGQIDSRILSSHFNISRRQFQRKFKEYTGLSPETYIRIIKFQQSLHLLRSNGYMQMSDIAYGLNYADQSHFNREFKLFSGYTPKKFLKENRSRLTFPGNDVWAFEPLRIVK